MGIDRGHLLSSLVGGLIAVVVVATLPVGAADGDTMVVGAKNTAKTVTRLNTRGGLRIDNFKGGNPALILEVADPGVTPPLQVNSDALVTGLNADLLDGMDAGDFAAAVAVDEGLAVGQSKVIATVTGAGLIFQCNDDGGGGLRGQVLVQALAGDLHAVFRDPVSLAAQQVYGWDAGNAIGIGAFALLFEWDPDKTKQEFLDGSDHMYRFPLTVSSPKGGVIDGELIGVLSNEGADDCNLTGYLVTTG